MVLADFGFLETKYALNRDGKFWYFSVIEAKPPEKEHSQQTVQLQRAEMTKTQVKIQKQYLELNNKNVNQRTQIDYSYLLFWKFDYPENWLIKVWYI